VTRRAGRSLRGGFVFLALLLFLSPVVAGEEAGVARVIDGDTIILSDGRHVRYVGINTPEMPMEDFPGEPFAAAAKRLNAELAGKTVQLEYGAQAVDHHGRHLAHVYTGDGRSISAEIISRGLGYCLFFQKNALHQAHYLDLQRRAMAARRGIWQCWREEAGATYTGNRNSRRFHRTSCRFGRQTRSDNRVVFSSKWSAFYQGYAPCAKCMPRGEILELDPRCLSLQK
jgi:micrococcal nuclease